MLNVMRENLRHLKWVLWIVALSMVFYLGAFFSCEDPARQAGNWAAMVGETQISFNRFRDTARNLDQQYRNMFGESYEQLKPQLQLGSQAIQRLIERELIREDAQQLGIEATNQEIADQIRSDPSLQDENGNFIGTERYKQILSRFGGAEAYEADVAIDIVIQKWSRLVSQSVTVGDDELEETHRQRTEKTAVNYFVLPAAEQQVDLSIDDDEVRAWYDAHAEDYRRDEGRRIRFVVVDREAQLEGVQITEEEILAAYRDNEANYTHPEQRRARHILFRTEPGATEDDKAAVRTQAEAVLARLQSGEDFAALARSTSQDPVSGAQGGDLSFFSRGDMVPAFENAVWETPVGQLTGIVESQFGLHIIEVTDSRDAGVTPLEDVREEIERTARLRRSQDLVLTTAERLGQDIRSGASLDEVAAREELEISERLVTRDERLFDIGASPDFIGAVFDLEPGELSSALSVAAGLALVVVDEVVPSSIPPLEEVDSQVRTDVLNDRTRKRAVERAEGSLSRGGSFESIAKRLGEEIQESGDLTPGQGLPGTGGTGEDLRASLFAPALVEGDRGVIEVPAGALVYEVTHREPFDPVAFETALPELRRELMLQRRTERRQAAVEQLRAREEILINQEMIDRLNG